jgi:putative transcriptional regulator
LKTKIKELREKRNLTQESLAEKVDVTRQTILFLEKGKYNPSLRLAYKIAKVLNSKIEDVFSFEDERL